MFAIVTESRKQYGLREEKPVALTVLLNLDSFIRSLALRQLRTIAYKSNSDRYTLYLQTSTCSKLPIKTLHVDALMLHGMYTKLAMMFLVLTLNNLEQQLSY